MKWMAAFLSRLVNAPEWRDIVTAPSDRAIEIAVIGGDVEVLSFPCLRHGDAWFDAETLKPVSIGATHWRYCQSGMLPISCC